MNTTNQQTSATINLIGLGVAETVELDSHAQQALEQSPMIIGSERQLATIEHLLNKNQQTIVLPKLAQLKALLNQNNHSCIAVLASGDPNFYGIGRWLNNNIDKKRIASFPAVSSIQMACHRLGLSLQDCDVVSLHGRPLETLRIHLKQNKTLIVLTDQHSLPQHLAQECHNANLKNSSISVCEQLGYSSEKISEFTISELLDTQKTFHPLHVSVIQCAGAGGVLPEFPGIPDHHFETGKADGKGMISKKEVRLCILSNMQLAANDIVWDIGAGCGGVSVELALWQQQAKVYAIECHPQRLEYLTANRSRFGVVSNLHIVAGEAPQVLADLPVPNKIFIGGSNGELLTLMRLAFDILPDNGVLVLSSVTEKTKQIVHNFAVSHKQANIECSLVSVNRGHWENQSMQYVEKLPVEIIKFTKSMG